MEKLGTTLKLNNIFESPNTTFNQLSTNLTSRISYEGFNYKDHVTFERIKMRELPMKEKLK